METIVLYPAPGISHVVSMVELGKLLLTQSSTLSSITILVPSFPFGPPDSATSSYMSSISSSMPSITFHSLPIVPLQKDLSDYPDGGYIIFESLRNNNANVHEALASIVSSSSHVSAFIIDFFAYPSLDIAKSLNIPTYFFFTSSAATLALCINFPEFDQVATDTFRNLKSMSFEIPGLFAVPASEMIDVMLDGGVTYDEFVNMGAYLTKSHGLMVNTFEALEPRACKALQEGSVLPGTPVPPIYCVGPLIAKSGDKSEKRHECLTWLDSQPSQSVVYLCFGSRASFPEEQIREIALGLERSKVRFLWVLRGPQIGDFKQSPCEPDLDVLLPEGFLERTKDRGLVVKSWAPQISVLEHESVGGFVTHCGWNSVLEAVCAGIPMVAWPIYAEQRFQKIVIVEELRIALPMENSEVPFVSSDKIEMRVKQIIDSKEGDAPRKRVLDLKDEAKAALSEGGSSKVSLSSLVKSWKC